METRIKHGILRICIIWLCHYYVQCFMSPWDNRGTRDLLHIIIYTWANGSLYSTADDNKWKILLFIFSVLFVKTFRCFVSLCIHTQYFYSACWTAFIGANSSKIVAYWTAHTESSSACACVCVHAREHRSGIYNNIEEFTIRNDNVY